MLRYLICMEDDTLLKISLLTSIVGIFSLFLFLQLEEVEYMSVKNFADMSSQEDAMNDVYIIGIVENINENNKTLLIDLVEYQKIKQKAILFKEDSKLIGINDGDIVEINGNWFNGKLVLNDIEKININNSKTN